jgi:hypothetical protein
LIQLAGPEVEQINTSYELKSNSLNTLKENFDITSLVTLFSGRLFSELK